LTEVTLPTRPHRGLSFTTLGAGCAQLGNLHRAISDEAAEATVRAAWESGIRYFDTAPHYGLGLSERRLGRALAAYPRDEYVLSTKVGRLLVPSPETAGQTDMANLFDVPADYRRVYDLSRDGVLRSIDDSLTRLGMDRIDVVYMHDPDEHWDAASTTGAETLAQLRDEGVIGGFGAGMNQGEMLADLIEQTDVDIVMCAGRLTLLEQHHAERMLALAAERDVAVVAAAVYNSGLLSREHGASLPAAAIQFPLRHPQVVSVVAGMRGATHVDEAVDRLAAPLPVTLWEALAEAGHIQPAAMT
jgi:D-threo-aldose 1-dehydrogenase